MAVNELLSRLSGVKKTGPGTWIAKCPAHTDRSPSLSIRDADDGRVLLHCFAECSTSDVLAAVGLRFTDIMPERVGHYRPRMRPAFPPSDVLEILGREVMLVAMAANEMSQGRQPSDVDRVALIAAADRCTKALGYVSGR